MDEHENAWCILPPGWGHMDIAEAFAEVEHGRWSLVLTPSDTVGRVIMTFRKGGVET